MTNITTPLTITIWKRNKEIVDSLSEHQNVVPNSLEHKELFQLWILMRLIFCYLIKRMMLTWI